MILYNGVNGRMLVHGIQYIPTVKLDREVRRVRVFVHLRFINGGLVVSAPAWDGTDCEFDSWQCRIYIPCSLSLRLLGSLRGSLGTYDLTQKIVLKMETDNSDELSLLCIRIQL